MQTSANVHGEDTQQLLLGCIQFVLDLHPGHVLGTGQGRREIQHHAVCPDQRALLPQTGRDGLMHAGRCNRIDGFPDRAGIAAGGPDDADLVPGAPHTDDALRCDAEHGGNLGDRAGREIVQIPCTDQYIAGLDDHLQATTGTGDRMHLHPGAGVGGQQRVQTLDSELRLRPVVIDVIVLHDLTYRRKTRLPGHEHDAQLGIPEHFADRPGQPETRVVRFHDHIEQHHRNVLLPGQDLCGLGMTAGLQQFNLPAEHAHAGKSEGHGALEVGVIIDSQHPPEIRIRVGTGSQRLQRL